MTARITIDFSVPAGYQRGDYCRLCGNGGAGDIDYDSPLTEKLDMFPHGSGIHGWGHAPWGHFRWGHAYGTGCPGWGHQRWGHFPWGYGTTEISVVRETDECGDWLFAFACYDELGNLHSGSPTEVSVIIHIAPPAPDGLKAGSYNKNTDVLVLHAL